MKVGPWFMKLYRIILLLSLVLLTGCALNPRVKQSGETVAPTLSASSALKAITTPKYTPFTPLLAQVAAVGPVYVTGDASVSVAALQAAGEMLAIMLQHRPDIGAVLRAHGAFTAVSFRTEHVCSLPYFSMYSPALCKSYGDGGAGGTLYRPVTACDEKNVLALPGDSYERYDRSPGTYSQNVCVHELAHGIMNIGLSQADRDRIQARFLAVQKEGLWTGDYAMTNDMEFWAVMSQNYFWAGLERIDPNAAHHIANGPAALKLYDPQTFALLDSIYQGSVNLR